MINTIEYVLSKNLNFKHVNIYMGHYGTENHFIKNKVNLSKITKYLIKLICQKLRYNLTIKQEKSMILIRINQEKKGKKIRIVVKNKHTYPLNIGRRH